MRREEKLVHPPVRSGPVVRVKVTVAVFASSRLVKVQVAVALPLPASTPPSAVQVPLQVAEEPVLAVAVRVMVESSGKSALLVVVAG